MTLIVGIDASLTRTAVALGSDPASVRLFTVEIPSMPGSIRNRFIRYQSIVNNVIECLRIHDSPMIFLEGYNFMSKTAGVTLAEFGGLLRSSLLRMTEECGELIEVPPKSLKAFVAENGNADKEMMAAKSYARWGIRYATNDEVDAYGLWRFGRVFLGLDGATSIAQLQAIKMVKCPVKKVKKRRTKTAPVVKTTETSGKP